jgi:hypothetical protein
MNNRRSKIDKVFRKRLYDYKVIPPYEVWEDVILYVTRSRKVRRRSVYLKYAASLSVLIALGSWLFMQADFLSAEKPPAVLTRSDNHSFRYFFQEPPVASGTIERSDQSTGNKQDIAKYVNPEKIHRTSANDTKPMPAYSMPVSFNTPREHTGGLQKLKPLESPIPCDPEIEPRLHYKEDASLDRASVFDNPEEQESHLAAKNHFTLKTIMSPVVSYRRIPNELSRDEYNTTERELVSYMGGLNLGYKLSERLSIHSGLYYTRIGQTVSKIRLGSDAYTTSGEKNIVLLSNSLGRVEVDPASFNHARSSENVEKEATGGRLLKQSYNLNASVIQRFEYLKIPLLFEYTMVDKTIDINLIGGLSSNFLVNEGVYMRNQTGNTKLIGNTNNIRRYNYSGSLGVGMQYAFTSKFKMYVEPQVDYFINPINTNETKTYPYSFAVQTGLNITF